MTAPHLAEVLIVVGDLDAATEAWYNASALVAAADAPDRREAVIDVGGVRIRFVEKGAEGFGGGQPYDGLAMLTLGVPDAASAAGRLRRKGVEFLGAEDDLVIDPRSSHGVPIRLLQETGG